MWLMWYLVQMIKFSQFQILCFLILRFRLKFTNHQFKMFLKKIIIYLIPCTVAIHRSAQTDSSEFGDFQSSSHPELRIAGKHKNSKIGTNKFEYEKKHCVQQFNVFFAYVNRIKNNFILFIFELVFYFSRNADDLYQQKQWRRAASNYVLSLLKRNIDETSQKNARSNLVDCYLHLGELSQAVDVLKSHTTNYPDGKIEELNNLLKFKKHANEMFMAGKHSLAVEVSNKRMIFSFDMMHICYFWLFLYFLNFYRKIFFA